MGEPIQTSTGEFFYRPVPDFNLGGPIPLYFKRDYSSRFTLEKAVVSALGPNWMHNFNLRLDAPTEQTRNVIFHRGKIIRFAQGENGWAMSDAAGIVYQLAPNSDGTFFLLDPRTARVYVFAADDGRLLRIADRNGNSLNLGYVQGNLSVVNDGLGRAMVLSYSENGQLTTIADSQPRVRFTYEDGRLASFVNAAGKTTAYSYDLDQPLFGPLLTSTTHPLGNRPFTQDYGQQGRVASQTDAFQNRLTLTYNTPETGQTTVTRPDQLTEIFAFQGVTALTRTRDAQGNEYQCDYDASGRRTGFTDQDDQVSAMTYHPPTGLPASMTDALGNTIVLTWQGTRQTIQGAELTFHDLTRVEYGDNTFETFTPDSRGNVLEHRDRAGGVWEYAYNERGHILEERNPLGGVVRYAYNDDATLASLSRPLIGETITYAHDARKRLTGMTMADDTDVVMEYDAMDRIVAFTDENQRTTRFAYDDNGNLVRITDPDDNETVNHYDALDRLTRTTDPTGKVTEYGYDVMGRLNAATRNPGESAITNQFAYDPDGRPTRFIDGDGKIWQTAYTAAGHLETETTPLGHVTRHATDALGRVVRTTDPLGNETRLTYDALGNLTGFTDPMLRTFSFSYDGLNLPTSTRAPLIGQADYARNAMGGLISITDPEGKVWRFGHNALGLPTSFRDPQGRETTVAYSQRGLPSLITSPTGITETITHDPAGNPIRRAFSDGTVIQTTYDAGNRPVSRSGTSLTRDGMGRIVTTRAHGVDFGATYDAAGRVRTATYADGAFAVTYTSNGRDQIVRAADSLTNAWVSLDYDDDGRLVRITRSNGLITEYAWDAAARITGIQDENIASRTITRNAAGEPTQVTATGPGVGSALPAGSVTLEYDDAVQIQSTGYASDQDGRAVVLRGVGLTWDGAGRLTGISAHGQEPGVKLTYDGFDNLLERTQDEAIQRYHYNHALRMQPLVAEQAGSGAYLRYYVYSPEGLWLYGIDATTGQPFFPHFDHIGSTQFLTDASGQVTDVYTYTPYGLTTHVGDNAQPFTFIGQYGVRAEGRLDLLHMRARYYDALSGRFLSRDPLWPDLMNLNNLNPYVYAGLNPLLNIDPEGKFFFTAILVVAGLVVAYHTVGKKVIERVEAANQRAKLPTSTDNVIRDRKIAYRDAYKSGHEVGKAAALKYAGKAGTAYKVYEFITCSNPDDDDAVPAE